MSCCVQGLERRVGAVRRRRHRAACSATPRRTGIQPDPSIQVLRTLPPKTLSAAAATALDTQPPLPVVCLSWNCSGNVIAVASGSCSGALLEHHAGHILTWNTSRSVMNPLQPDLCIDIGVGACCCSLAFHPQQPSLLAGGTSTGAIFMYHFPALF